MFRRFKKFKNFNYLKLFDKNGKLKSFWRITLILVIYCLLILYALIIGV